MLGGYLGYFDERHFGIAQLIHRQNTALSLFQRAETLGLNNDNGLSARSRHLDRFPQRQIVVSLEIPLNFRGVTFKTIFCSHRAKKI